MSFWIAAVILLTAGPDGKYHAPKHAPKDWSLYHPRESCFTASRESTVARASCETPGITRAYLGGAEEHYVQIFASEDDCLMANGTAEGNVISYQGKLAARQCVRVTMDKVSSEPPSTH